MLACFLVQSVYPCPQERELTILQLQHALDASRRQCSLLQSLNTGGIHCRPQDGSSSGPSHDSVREALEQSALHFGKYKQIRDDYHWLLSKYVGLRFEGLVCIELCRGLEIFINGDARWSKVRYEHQSVGSVSGHQVVAAAKRSKQHPEKYGTLCCLDTPTFSCYDLVMPEIPASFPPGNHLKSALPVFLDLAADFSLYCHLHVTASRHIGSLCFCTINMTNKLKHDAHPLCCCSVMTHTRQACKHTADNQGSSNTSKACVG